MAYTLYNRGTQNIHYIKIVMITHAYKKYEKICYVKTYICICFKIYDDFCCCFLQAKDVLKLIDDKRGPIDDLERKVIGQTRVLIDGDSKNCRRQECNMGNLICDAILDYVRFLINLMISSSL